MPTIVDLFSGCGGFGLGAKQAGFDCRVAIDVDPVILSSYRLNFPATKCVQADIASLDKGFWEQFFKESRPDGVIGGPPCQGFSRIGKQDVNDPRNSLIDHFFNQILILSPKFFVMENVEGILDSSVSWFLDNALEKVSKEYRLIGPLKIKASDYGVPTSRTRVIIIGYRVDEMSELSADNFLPSAKLKETVVKDAISDLPSPVFTKEHQKSFLWTKYPEASLRDLSPYARKARSLPNQKGIGYTESLNRLMQGQSTGHLGSYHSQEVSMRYSALENGSVDKISKSKRLKWDGFCPTLRAGTGPEKGSYQAVRPIHPSEGRVLTVREAARLQGFPDWFVFHPTKWTSFRMIGNSVSPLVADFLLQQMFDKLT